MASTWITGSGASNPGNVVTGGRIGAGISATTDPAASLEVRGDVRLGWDNAASNPGPAIIMVPSPVMTGATLATDNRNNIQAAIDLAANNGGGTVVLQKGIYEVNENVAIGGYAILIRNGVHLVGASMLGTRIRVANGTGNISVIFAENPPAPPNQVFLTFVIKDLFIDGNNQTNITGINLQSNSSEVGPQPALVENVRIERCASVGVQVMSWWTELHNCFIRDCATGIDLNYPGAGATNSTTILHCNVWGDNSTTMTTGIRINGYYNQVIGCNIGGFASNGIGINLNSGAGNYVVGNYLETSCVNATGIRIANRGNTISGNYFDMTASKAITCTDSAFFSGTVLSCNYCSWGNGNYPIQNNINMGMRIVTAPVNGSDNIATANGGGTNVFAPYHHVTTHLHTSGSSTIVTTTDGAFNPVYVGTRIIANGVSRIVVWKHASPSNEIHVDHPVNWDNAGNGYEFDYQQPIFNGLATGIQITANSLSRYLVAISDDYNATVGEAVDWYSGGSGYGFTFKHPLLLLNEGSSTYLVVDPSGSVGINTPTPGAKLDVSKPTQDAAPALILGGGANGYLLVNPNASAGSYNSLVQAGDKAAIFSNGTIESGALVIGPWSNSPKGIRMDSDGNVGIGTALTGYIDGQQLKLNVSGYAGFNGLRVGLDGSNDILADSANGLTITSKNAGAKMQFKTGGTGNIRMTIDSAGNVGIGETSPSAKLDIVHSGPGTRGIEVNCGANATDGVVIIRNGIAATNFALLINNAGDKMRVDFNGNGYFAGAVGIGPTNPGTKLEVTGPGHFCDSGTSPDNQYNGNLRITRAASGTAQYINLTRAGSFPWSIGMVYGSNSFAIGQGQATESNFSGTNVFLTIDSTGKVGIGQTAPASGLHIGASAGGSNKGYITEENIGQTPTLTADGQMAIYSKGNKICIAKRVSGITRYTSIDMSGNGNSWSTSTTTAP